MLKNIWRRQKGLTLIELLIAVALFAIIMPAFIAFSRTAISNDNNLQNQANATNQLKNAFNYVSQDVQMASLVITNPDPQYTPANCVLELQWLNYPIDAITVYYTLNNGILQRIYTDSGVPANNSTIVVATNVNSNPANTYFTWASNSLSVNLTVTIGSVNEVRQFQITPRVTQKSAQIPNIITLAQPTPNPAYYHSTVTLLATFSPSSVKSGTVVFLDSGNPIPIGTAPVINGSATCTVSTLEVRNHVITAVYSGDATYVTSTSGSQNLTIIKGSSSTAASVVPTTYYVGDPPVTFTATIAPSDATGIVEFISNISGDSLDVIVGVSAGTASTQPITPSSVIGVHTITATYSGDSNYNSSTGTCGVTVKNYDPVLTSISPTSCNAGAAQFTLAANGSNFIATSVINFNGTALTTAYVNSGQLTALVPASLLVSAGTKPVTIQTPGADHPSGAINFTVIGAPNAKYSMLTVVPSPANILANGITKATLIVQAKDINSNNLTTGGATVVFTKSGTGTGTLSSVTDNGNGTYTATVTAPAAIGSNVFVASLNGGTVNNGGTSQTQVTVTYVSGFTIIISSDTKWSLITGGSGPGGHPSATDIIIINTGSNVEVDSPTAVANTVKLGDSSGLGTLTFDSGSQLIVGTLTTNTSGNVDMTSGGLLVVTTSWTPGLTLNPGIGSINFGGAGSQTLPSDIAVYNNLSTVGSVTATTSRITTVTGNLVISSGTTFSTGSTNSWTLGVTGTTLVSGTLNLANTGTKNFTGDVTINSGGVWNETSNAAVNFVGNFTNNGATFTANSGLHTFSGDTKTIGGSTATSISNVAITGTYTNTGTLTVGTALTGTGTLTNGNGVAGILNIGGTSTITALTATANGNTVNYNGGGQTVKVITYSNLILSGSGNKTLATGTSVTNNLSIAPTGTATASISTGINLAVNTLTLGGVGGQATGTWGNNNSSATHKSNTYFRSGTNYKGIITVAH